MRYVNHVATSNSIVVVTDEGLFQVSGGTPAFTKVKDLLARHQYNEALKLIYIPTRLKAYSGGKFSVVDGQVFFNNEALPAVLSQRLLDFCDADIECTPLIKFWENVRKNPSEDSKKDLFGFLEHNGIPITADGCFIGYKRVQDDFSSHQSGVWVEENETGNWTLDSNQRYDNSPGMVVSMPRDKVDPVRENTCSSGLHVAAFAYAKDKYMSGGRLVEIKVNPMNVVTVPVDYNLEKLRACEYTVIRECVEEYTKPFYTEDNSYQDFVDGEDEISDETIEEDESDGMVSEREENQREENLRQTLTFDARDRTCIPAAMIRELGLNDGDLVEVLYNNNGKEVFIAAIGTSGIFDNSKEYTVDQYDNVRIGSDIFETAGLGHRQTIKAEVDGDEIRLF